jgi:hypothetical protein
MWRILKPENLIRYRDMKGEKHLKALKVSEVIKGNVKCWGMINELKGDCARHELKKVHSNLNAKNSLQDETSNQIQLKLIDVCLGSLITLLRRNIVQQFR